MANEQDSTMGGAGEDDVETTTATETAPAEPKEPETEPEPEKPAKPAAKKAAEPEEKPERERDEAGRFVSPLEKRLADLESKIDADDFDPYSKEGKQIIKEHARVAGQVAAMPANENAVFADYADRYDLTTKEARAAWKETIKSLPDKYKNDQGAANYAYEQKLAALQAEKAEKSAAATTVTTPAPLPPKPKAKGTPVIAAGQVLPRGVGSVPPQPPTEDPRSLEDRVKDGDPATLKQFREAFAGYFGRED